MSIVRLVVDWKTSEARAAFVSSAAFAALTPLWQSRPSTFDLGRTPLFAMSKGQQRRHSVLSAPCKGNEDCIIVLFRSHFSNTLAHGSWTWSAWNGVVDSFMDAFEKHEGVDTNDWVEGWSASAADLDEPSPLVPAVRTHLVILRFLNVASARDFVECADNDGELSRMRELADCGVEVEYVRMAAELKR